MNETMNSYEAPLVEVVEVKVEKGFATSAAPIDDMPYGGEWK